MVWTIRFCSNLPACGSNTYQIIYGETLDLQFQHQQWCDIKIKCPIGKSNFAVNLPINLFHATVANADIGSLKSLHTFLTQVFVPYASEIWTKSYGPNYTKFWVFDKKLGFFYNHFWQNVDSIGRRYCS